MKKIQRELDFASGDSDVFKLDASDEPKQGILDFENRNQDGLENFRAEQEKILEAVRNEWHIPVGRRVRIRLVNIDGEFEGKLKLAERPKVMNKHHSLFLKLDKMDISISEIEQCTVLD